ncbi:MAG: hypothetical protein OXI01_14185 [Albidovulum sp.]|nr:hypothetical protein [Albidovulum sp.]
MADFVASAKLYGQERGHPDDQMIIRCQEADLSCLGNAITIPSNERWRIPRCRNRLETG